MGTIVALQVVFDSLLLFFVFLDTDFSSITLRTVDIDVVVLAVAASTRYDEKEIWVNFGTGESKKILSAHQIGSAIGRDKAVALPVFHAFTGCDTVSSFKSIGKKTAWQRWKVFDDVTKAFIELSNGPANITSETQRLLERFVILLYDQTSSCTSVNQLRKELFTRGRSIDKIPPTSGTLLQHVRRTAYQGGYIWGKSHEKSINPPEATNWGWQKDKSGRYNPLWSLLPIASKACSQLIKCCCKQKDGSFNCSGRCSCAKVRQTCTELCKCKAACPYSIEFKESDEPIVDTDDDDSITDEIESENGEEDYTNEDIYIDFDADIDILFGDDF